MQHAVPSLRAHAATTEWSSSCSQGFSSVTQAQRLRLLDSFQERTCVQRTSDILTQAFGNCLTAVDVGITSPDALYAGRDCTQSMVDRKLEHYGQHLDILERQNIEYAPLVWSSYGRPHARAVSVLRTLSKKISRRRGTVTAQAVYHSLHAATSTEIWRRAARQGLNLFFRCVQIARASLSV